MPAKHARVEVGPNDPLNPPPSQIQDHESTQHRTGLAMYNLFAVGASRMTASGSRSTGRESSTRVSGVGDGSCNIWWTIRQEWRLGPVLCSRDNLGLVGCQKALAGYFRS